MDQFCQGTQVWNSNLTLNSDWPKLTTCFQSTVLVWGITGWIWIISPVYTFYLYLQKVNLNPISWKFILKVTLFSIDVVLHFVEVIIEVVRNSSVGVWNASVMEPCVYTLTEVLILVFVVLERRKGFVTSGVLFLYWTIAVIIGIIPFYSKLLNQEYSERLVKFIIFYITYSLHCIQLILSCLRENTATTENEKTCPIARSSWPSRITFWWMNRFMIRGFKKPLTEDDLFDLPYADKADNVAKEFDKRWQQKMDSIKSRHEDLSFMESNKEECGISLLKLQDKQQIHKKVQCSLLPSLVRTFGLEFSLIQLINLIRCGSVFINPVLFRILLEVIENDDPNSPVWKGYVIALAMFFSSTLASFLMIHVEQSGQHLGLRINAALQSKIFRKALTLNNESRKTTSVGEIINLLSDDLAAIKEDLTYIRGTWDSILQISVALLLLYQLVGNAMFAGFGVLCLTIPIKIFCISRTYLLQEQIMKDKDKRLNLLSEVLNGIKVLKLYTWELVFKEKVMTVRNIELKKLITIKLFERIQETLFHITPFLVSFTTYLTYIHINNRSLDAEIVFVSLSLFNILKYALDYSSYVFRDLVKIIVSIKRIEKFLNLEDLSNDCITKCTSEDKNAVLIKNGSFMWDSEIGEALKDVNIDIQKCSLVAVVGQVGQGKSSLLSAMLGEMLKVCGQVSVEGTVAYVPQQAWIQNSTLKNNILFGSSMDTVKYNSIIDACALCSDLEILPVGDRTEIGEKGINLSGGQKQRVSLARAVYNEADVYYLDDPLSAVDSQVGKHIFERVISNEGLLKNKTRILATHGIQWLPKVDKIIVLKNGVISEVGTYDELLDHAGAFAEFLQNYLMENNEEDPIEDGFRDQVMQRLLSITSSDEGSLFEKRFSNYDTMDKKSIRDSGTNSSLIQNYYTEHDHNSKGCNAVTYNSRVNDKAENGDKISPENNLIEEESVEVGQVKLGVFMGYFRALGIHFTLLMGFCYAASHGMSVLGNMWLAEWTDDPILKFSNLTESKTEQNVYFSGVYASFGIGQGITILVFGITCNYRMIAASRLFHNKLLHTVIRAPMKMFDTTPIGRIINRFSRDMEVIDIDLPWTIENWMYCFLSLIGSLIVISYSAYWFLLVVIPLAIIYFAILKFYIPTSRQLRRIESKLRSPILNYFSECINGANVIRAFKAENRFIAELHKRIDIYHQSLFATICCDSWKGLRLQMLGNVVILVAAVFAVTGRGNVSAGVAGLSLTYALDITSIMNWLLILTTLMETNVVSVERVNEYAEKETEADLINENHKPPKHWPKSGEIALKHYSTRYRPGLDLILKDVNAKFASGEKVGIVGRTGAGKSSLALALFRLIEPAEGFIEIDGENICELGLHDCRSKLTILPQDPVLFSGSLRMNIDPMDAFTDNEIWKALEHAHLKSFIGSLPSKLEYECGEGGNNLSVGQKQLVCLARSLLQKTKILILDEATAAVDLETDALIQQTIKEDFRDCTVLTIAHRLNTVIDYDRIIVLDRGAIQEFDTPNNLLSNKTGLFYKLARDAGIVS